MKPKSHIIIRALATILTLVGFVSHATAETAPNVIIDLSTLTPGVSTSGSGWAFDTNGALILEGDLPYYYHGLILHNTSYHYKLMGSAVEGIEVDVLNAAALTLDNLTLGSKDRTEIKPSITVHIKNRVTLNGPMWLPNYDDIHQPVIMDTAAGSLFNINSDDDGIRSYRAIVIQGSGTVNIRYNVGGEGMRMDSDVTIKDNVTVTVSAPDSAGYNGSTAVNCDVLTVADHAKLTAIGQNYLGDGGTGGDGVGASTIVVTSDAPNALTAIGGTSRIITPDSGNGITGFCLYDDNLNIIGNFSISGTGQIKTIGNNGIYSWEGDIILAGATITAEGRGRGHALYAEGIITRFTGSAAGGTVHITSGRVTAFNRDIPANVYYKYLNKTGGTLNEIIPDTYALSVANGSGAGNYEANESVTVTAHPAPTGKVFDRWTSSNGGTFANANASATTFTMPANATTVTAVYKDQSSGSGGGGGGGGATSLPVFVLIASLLALRIGKQRRI